MDRAILTERCVELMNSVLCKICLACVAVSALSLVQSHVVAQEIKDARPHLWSIGIVEGSSPFSLKERLGFPNPRFTAMNRGYSISSSSSSTTYRIKER